MGIKADLTVELREKNRIPDTDEIRELQEVLKRTRAELMVSVDDRNNQVLLSRLDTLCGW
jgi:hypothetical protein